MCLLPLPRDQFCFYYWLCIQTTTIFHCELHHCLCRELVASPATMSSWISTDKSLWVMKDLKEVWIAQRGSDLLIENAFIYLFFFRITVAPPPKNYHSHHQHRQHYPLQLEIYIDIDIDVHPSSAFIDCFWSWTECSQSWSMMLVSHLLVVCILKWAQELTLPLELLYQSGLRITDNFLYTMIAQ